MATLTNINPKKNPDEEQETPVSGQSSSMISPTSQVSGAAITGVQKGTPGSGRFTNIQKYMGANQGAGTQLGQAIGQNVDKSISKSTGEANKAQNTYETGIGTGQQELGKINQYTTNLSQKQADTPANEQGAVSKVTGPEYLASGYQANLGERANYAQQLAGDENKLNTFLNYRSGKIAADQQKALQDQQNAAQIATDKTGETFNKTQDQLKNPNQRGSLLNDVARSRTYGTGQQSLDKAFLQMDKANTVGNLQKDLQQKQQLFNSQSKLPSLTEQGLALKNNLGDATIGLQKQTEQNLADLSSDISSREVQMNKARQDRLKNLEAQFKALQGGKEITQDFANALGFKEGDYTYNTLADLPGVSNVIDTSQLQQLAQSQSDLANQGDVSLMSALAKLAQTNPALMQASKLGDFQQSDTFKDRLNQGKERYDTTMSNLDLAQSDMNSRSHSSNVAEDMLRNPGRYGMSYDQVASIVYAAPTWSTPYGAGNPYGNPVQGPDLSRYQGTYDANRQAYHDSKEEVNRLAAIRDLLTANAVKVKK